MVVNAFRMWRAVQGAAKAAAKAKAAVQQEAVKRGEAEAALLAARKAGVEHEVAQLEAQPVEHVAQDGVASDVRISLVVGHRKGRSAQSFQNE